MQRPKYVTVTMSYQVYIPPKEKDEIVDRVLNNPELDLNDEDKHGPMRFVNFATVVAMRYIGSGDYDAYIHNEDTQTRFEDAEGNVLVPDNIRTEEIEDE